MFAVAHVDTGSQVSPYIGGALPGAVVSQAGQKSPDNQLFPSAIGTGGTSVRGANAPARQEPGRSIASRDDAPTMQHIEETFGNRVNQGIETAGSGFDGFVRGTGDAARIGAIGAYALTSSAIQGGINSLTTQGPSYTFGDVQPPQQDMNPGQNAALMEAMHWATRMKQEGIQLDGNFSTADLGDLKEVATNPQAIEFMQAKQQQGVGVA